MGTAQLSRKSGRQTRYYLKVDGREGKMSIPCRHTGKYELLCDAEIDPSVGNWKKSHIKTIQQYYGKAPYFKEYFDEVAGLIEKAEGPIGVWNEETMRWVLNKLGIQVEWVQDKELVPKRPEHPSDWILEMCRKAGATVYHCGKVAADRYLKYEDFKRFGIEVIRQDWKCPRYRQVGHGGFLENLCVLDAMMNLGKDGTLEVLAGREVL